MNAHAEAKSSAEPIPNGPGAAAILSAAIGCFALGVIAVACDKVQLISHLLDFYRPTGPLSGVTTVAISIWLATWMALQALWHRRDVAVKRINAIAIVLLIAGFLLTFPPIGDLF